MVLLVKCCQGRFIARRLLHYTGILDKLVQFKLSDIGEGIAEVQLKEWHVKVGDKVSEFDNLCEVQSDKASVTITSRYEGTVKKLHYDIDAVAKVGTTLVDIEVAEDVADNTANDQVHEAIDSFDRSHSSESIEKEETEGRGSRLLATPAVRRLIKEHNVDIKQINGSGRDGRVLKEDILKMLGKTEEIEEKPSESRPSPITFAPKIAEDKVVPIRGYTRAMMKSMSEALKIPHFGYSDEFTLDELIRLRDTLKHESKHRGIKLTYLPIIMKATSMALSEYPQLNAHADERHENMIYKAHHNITVAMDTPGGLVVPNIKNCEQKNIWEIAADLIRIQEAGKRQQISRDDLLGGTVTLSNIGIIGGTYAKPVLLPPQIVIGALGRIRKLPRFDRDNNVVPAHIMNMSWAADHRFVDGATLARFSNRLKDFLENPSTLVVAMR